MHDQDDKFVYDYFAENFGTVNKKNLDAEFDKYANYTKQPNADVNKLELNTEKEGFMAHTAPEDAHRPRAVYAINPDFRGI